LRAIHKSPLQETSPRRVRVVGAVVPDRPQPRNNPQARATEDGRPYKKPPRAAYGKGRFVPGRTVKRGLGLANALAS
jgi:hypothetical protein